MIVVLPIGQNDCMLASMLLRYLRDLRMLSPSPCLLIYDCRAQEQWRTQLTVLANSIFAETDVIETPHALAQEGWPAGPNWMHKTAAQWMLDNHKEAPWFWFEPDCTPLVPNWTDVLLEEHLFNKTPFTGNIQLPGVKDTYWRHVSGCRISPGNFFEGYGFIYDENKRAFDLEAAEQIIASTTQTNRMKHQYFIDTDTDILIEKGPPGGYDKIIPKGYVVPTFDSPGQVDELVRSGYVIQHRCKDGSLIRMAREYHNLD